MRVVVLGAGFAGLELSTRLSEELGDDVDVVLIDQSDGFVFGFSKLDVMFGRTTADAVFHPYRDAVKPGVQFVQAAIQSIDPAHRRVETERGARSRATCSSSRSAPTSTLAPRPAWSRTATSSTPRPARSRCATCSPRSTADGSSSGSRGRRSSARRRRARPRSSPHELLVSKGVRERSEVSLVMPLPVPIPPSPAASQALLAAFAERDIDWVPNSWCARARSRTPRRAARRRHRAALRPLPRHPGPRRAAGRRRVRADRRRLDPGRPAHAGDLVPRRLRGGRRHQRRHAEGRRVRRGAGRGRRRRDHRPPPRRRRRDLRRAGASVTSSSATARWARSKRSSRPGRRPPVSSRPRRSRSWATRPRSAPSASAAGSAASGRTSDGPVVLVGHNGGTGR